MSWRVIEGDCREALATLDAESVQTCVTSPPYWGLRDYGHEGQLGLEATPEEYVARMVEVFREVRRVLRPDGTLWLNLGDCYAGSWGNQGRKETRGSQRPINGPMMQNVGAVQHAIDCPMDEDCTCDARAEGVYPQRTRTGSWVNDHPTLKAKDLVGIPWRVAFALQADGWWLRSDIIWAKPNPMPESITDRPTKAHEYVFLFAKSERYLYDADAIREPLADANAQRTTAHYDTAKRYGAGNGGNGGLDGLAARMREGEHVARNRRTVWTITTKPFSGAHFAVMPWDLAEPCVLAGSRPGDTVLDPFAGSGTVGMVACRHGRSFVGVELNPSYAEMARERITGDAPLLNSAATEAA
jgi:DNA modification methylase